MLTATLSGTAISRLVHGICFTIVALQEDTDSVSLFFKRRHLCVIKVLVVGVGMHLSLNLLLKQIPVICLADIAE